MHPPRIPLRRASPRSPISLTHARTIRSIAPSTSTLPRTLLASPSSAVERRLASQTLGVRPGALATKKGMSAHYDSATGARTPVTLLQLDRVQVLAHKTAATHGYDAVVVGSGWQPAHRVNRAMLGVFASAKHASPNGGTVGVAPKRFVREFQVRGPQDRGGRESQIAVGQEIRADWFKVGDTVDVAGTTKGKGFAGGMKRWGFHGQPASHGVSLTHRSMGSSGGGQGSGSRVHPGKRMAGNMGNQGHTVQNLRVLSVDVENGIIAVSGAVPGPKKGLVKIIDAVKKPFPAPRDVEGPLGPAAEVVKDV